MSERRPDGAVDTPTAHAPTAPGGRGDAPAGTLAEGSGGALATPAGHGPGPGDLVGHFVLRERLGEGGMGVVFAADDADLGRRVAVKLVRDEAPGLRARLLREAQAMARVSHPNIVRVHEIGGIGDGLFIAMELIDGVTLTRWLTTTRSWREIVRMFAAVGAGLAAVHAAGLVHRDFKPDNVLVDRAGHPRVADFGLARIDREVTGLSPGLAAPLTRTGAMMGTPGYMAPEQQFGSDVDARADQYSYCVALRAALSGSWEAVPRGVRAAIMRGLSYDPADRFPALDGLLEAITTAARPRRIGVVAVIGATMLVGAATTAAIALSGGGAGGPGPAPAAVITARAGAADAAGAIAPPASAPIAIAPTGPTAIDAGIAAALEIRSGARAGAPIDAGPALAGPDVGAARISSGVAPPGAGSGSSVHLAPPPPFAGSGSALPTAPPDVVLGPVPRARLADARAAIRDLGYRGMPAGYRDGVADSIANLEAGRAKLIADGAGDDPRVPVSTAWLGALHRLAGDCDAATREWRAAAIAINRLPISDPKTAPVRPWWGRAHFGIGLCRLDGGDGPGAIKEFKQALFLGAPEVERAEVNLAWGVALFEGGDQPRGRSAIHVAGIAGDDLVHAAMERWMKTVGMTWSDTWH